MRLNIILSNPLVSVIIPYHNEGHLLCRAFESVLCQTYSGPIETIVVDDCSDVLPPSLVSRGLVSVRTIRNSRNLYAAGARNAGIRLASGQYLCFLDADDVYFPTRIDRHVRFLQNHPKVVMVGGQSIIHREGVVWAQDSRLFTVYRPELPSATEYIFPDRSRYDVCLHYPFHTPAITIPRPVLDRAGGFCEEYRWGEEWDLTVKIAQLGSVGYIPEPAFRYLSRPEGVCGTTNARKFESGAAMHRAWRKSISTLPTSYKTNLRSSEHGYLLLAAQTYLENHDDPVQALKCVLRAWSSAISVWAIRSLIRATLRVLASRL